MTINQPDRRSWPRRHKILTALGLLAAVIVVFSVVGALAGTGNGNGHPVAAASTPAPATTPATTAPASPAAAPAPSPRGRYQGSCDYTLSSGLYGNDHLIGEIDLVNTGNVGVIVKTRITWPQEGATPVTARKTVRLPYGAHKPVRFSIPVSGTGNVITLLQSWQDHHGLRDGCTYHAAFTTTFGTAHG
jgi:hypothetical protein